MRRAGHRRGELIRRPARRPLQKSETVRSVTAPTPWHLWTAPRWGHSSVGRALEWHSRGRRFDSAWLHQNTPTGLRRSERRGLSRNAEACPPLSRVTASPGAASGRLTRRTRRSSRRKRGGVAHMTRLHSRLDRTSASAAGRLARFLPAHQGPIQRRPAAPATLTTSFRSAPPEPARSPPPPRAFESVAASMNGSLRASGGQPDPAEHELRSSPRCSGSGVRGAGLSKLVRGPGGASRAREQTETVRIRSVRPDRERRGPTKPFAIVNAVRRPQRRGRPASAKADRAPLFVRRRSRAGRVTCPASRSARSAWAGPRDWAHRRPACGRRRAPSIDRWSPPERG